jgi:hypothetical protein
MPPRWTLGTSGMGKSEAVAGVVADAVVEVVVAYVWVINVGCGEDVVVAGLDVVVVVVVVEPAVVEVAVVEVVVVPDLHPEMMKEISKIQIRTPKTAFFMLTPLHYFVDKSLIAIVAPG